MLLMWGRAHADEIPIQAIGAIVRLVEIQIIVLMLPTDYRRATARLLFAWLLQLDLETASTTIPFPPDAPRIERQARQRMVEELRSVTLLLAANAPDEAKAYLTAAAVEKDHHRVEFIRTSSRALAVVARAELAALVEATLIEAPQPKRSRRDSMR